MSHGKKTLKNGVRNLPEGFDSEEEVKNWIKRTHETGLQCLSPQEIIELLAESSYEDIKKESPPGLDQQLVTATLKRDHHEELTEKFEGWIGQGVDVFNEQDWEKYSGKKLDKL